MDAHSIHCCTDFSAVHICTEDFNRLVIYMELRSILSMAANSNSKELDLFAELQLELETQNFVGLDLALELENIQSKFKLIFICTISLKLN